MRHARTRLVGVTAALAAVAAVAAPGRAAPAKPRFASPVLLTVDPGTGGYEPSVVVDKYGNVVVTAHKQNHSLVLSPDSRSATKVRSMSWIWYSTDSKTFYDMPGKTPLQEQNFEFGDEGDLAWDATGHLYFVDTNVTDNSFTRWKATGKGQLTLEATRPVGPFGEPLDDRPWIAAHGDGVVMYLGNMGNKDWYPLGQNGEGDGNGPGRYTVYMSYDHGDTFDPLGYSLDDSGWCRPAADKRPGSKTFYVLCTNDQGKLYAYVTNDDGKTFSRYNMGTYNDDDQWSTYPSVAVAKDGTVYALYADLAKNGNRLILYSSKTKGVTWTKRDVTPKAGQIRYSWLDIAPNGTLGIAYYYRSGTADWHVWAGTAKPGKAFTVAPVAPKQPVAGSGFASPFGDYFMCAFGPDNKLHVVWTSIVALPGVAIEGLNTEIYYAKQI